MPSDFARLGDKMVYEITCMSGASKGGQEKQRLLRGVKDAVSEKDMMILLKSDIGVLKFSRLISEI